MNILFGCECGANVQMSTLTGGDYCAVCGRFYETNLTENKARRIWLDDKVNAIDMMPVSQTIKQQLKLYAKKLILEERKTRGKQ